ncbi:MAG: histidine kinase [Tannerella sp.]|jgi:ligand-binding sensor domain-containing protein|nr:histidine kinase [Tannerella sp.]
MSKSLINTILAFTLLCVAAKAEVEEPLLKSEYSYRRYTTQDGLPTNMVENIFQDSRGFLWFSTESGAVRFDGYEFEGFLNHSIQKIEENDKGEIVIYGYSQVHILNPETDSIRRTFIDKTLNYSVYQSPGLPRGFALCEIRRTDSLVLFRLENDRLIRHFEHERLNDLAEYQSIYYDRQEKLYYIPSSENKLYVIDEQGIERNVFNNVSICRFLKRGNELLGIGYENVYSITNHGVKTLFKFEKPVSREDYFFCTLSPEGNIIIRDVQSVFRITGDGKRELILDGVNSPRAVFFDREGNFWHTSRQGIYNFFHLQIKVYKINENQADNVSSILPATDNKIYFTTERGLLIRLENDKFTTIHYPMEPNSSSFSYNSIQIGDALYFPTYSDILKYRNGHFSWLNLPPEIYYTTSCQMDEKTFVMGGWLTLKILDNNGKLLKKIPYDVIDKSVIYAAETDSAGRLWVGGFSGLSCIDGEHTLKFTNDSSGFVCAFSRDVSGKLWFIRGNEICYVSGDSIETFMKFDNNQFLNLVATKSGLLVVSDYSGIFIVDPETRKYAHYFYENGFPADEPQWLTMKEDFEGNIYLSTRGPNVIKFNPQTLFEQTDKVVLHIIDFSSSRNNADWTKIKRNSTLNPKENNLRITVDGLCFSNQQNVRYHYRLPGFQNEWSEPLKQREITFNNLPPGYYTFEIYADAGTDESRSEMQSFSFSIKPAFWQTAWFFVACVAMLILASAGVALYIQRRKNRALLEKLRAEKELNELRISAIRLKAIPHFNANILSAIEYYIANRTKEEVVHILEIYSDFTFQTLSEVDKAARPLSEELAYVKMYLDLEKIRFLDKFDFRIEVEDGVDESVQLPNMILHTYCENAVKHGLMPLASGGLLTIHVSQYGQIVCVSVEDNGVGRAYAAQNRQVHSSKQGLSILNRQIEIYNRFNREKITQHVEDLTRDGTPCGTLFTVEVPEEYTYIN